MNNSDYKNDNDNYHCCYHANSNGNDNANKKHHTDEDGYSNVQ